MEDEWGLEGWMARFAWPDMDVHCKEQSQQSQQLCPAAI